MKKVKQVEFNGAENRSKSLSEPPCFGVDFTLIPKPSKPWLTLFKLELEEFNCQQRGKDEKATEKLTWQFDQLEEYKFRDTVWTECSSVEEIAGLHEALKQLVRNTNDKLQAAEAKMVADKNELERLKQTLKSEI